MASGLRDKFRGCLLGAAVGDVVGAVVEAESPAYIAKTYRSVEDILAAGSVPEFSGPDWRVGRFTDDTQMTRCVAEWLLGDELTPQALLARFVAAYEPWRRYGSGTESILRAYVRHPDEWRELATAFFPEGSFGNGSAMRVAPVGLAWHDDPKKAASMAVASSRPTHSHPLGYQGAVLQCLAVAVAVNGRSPGVAPSEFLAPLRAALKYFDDLLQDTAPYRRALDAVEQGLARGASCAEMSSALGTGVPAQEAVPMALYCALRHPTSYADVVGEAVFLGGDADTIASMAGAISGALLGRGAIPEQWVAGIREDEYGPAAIEHLADRLFEKYMKSAESAG